MKSLASVVVPYIQQLGGVARVIKGTAPAGGVEKALAAAVAANPSGVIMFGVRWAGAGHAMIAVRFGGRMVILDRTGKVVTSLSKLPYKGIASATLDEMVLIENATAATVMEALGVTAAAVNGILAAPEPDGASSGSGSSDGQIAAEPPLRRESVLSWARWASRCARCPCGASVACGSSRGRAASGTRPRLRGLD